MNIFGIVIIISLFIYLGVGFYSSKNLKSTDDFYVMGRNAPAYLITGTMIATNISSVAFVGYVGSVYSRGSLPYLTMFGATLASSVLLGLYVGRYIQRMKLYTVPDYFTTRYPKNEVVKIASTVIVLFSMLIFLISVCQGVNVVLVDIFGLSNMTAQLIILGIVTVFTMAGGMKGVVVTDTIMFVIFFVAAMLVAPSILSALGGWPQGITAAAEKLTYGMTWKGNFDNLSGFFQWVEVNIASIVLVLASPQLLSRAFIAKSEKTFGRAMILQALIFPIFIFTLLFLFSWLPAANPDLAPTSAFTWAAMNLAPKWIGALALAGITAAALSSASSLFQQAAAALSRDIYERYINPTATEKNKLLVSRICVLIIAVVCFIAGTTKEITAVGLVYGFLFATAAWAAWFPALLLGIFWKKASAKAAAWSMALGFISAMIFVFGRTNGFTPAWLPPNLVGVVVSAVVFVVVASITQPTAEELAVFSAMRQPSSPGDGQKN